MTWGSTFQLEMVKGKLVFVVGNFDNDHLQRKVISRSQDASLVFGIMYLVFGIMYLVLGMVKVSLLFVIRTFNDDCDFNFDRTNIDLETVS